LTQALLAWGPAVTWAAVLFLLSEAQGASSPTWIPAGDKVAHFGLYAVLGGTLAWAGFRGRLQAAGPLLGLGMLYGALDEMHQGFVPGRDPSLGDWIADAVGVMVGFLVLRFLLGRPGSAPGNNTNRNH